MLQNSIVLNLLVKINIETMHEKISNERGIKCCRGTKAFENV